MEKTPTIMRALMRSERKALVSVVSAVCENAAEAVVRQTRAAAAAELRCRRETITAQYMGLVHNVNEGIGRRGGADIKLITESAEEVW
jgi:hypothetical protein